jgi:hypothetical protein
MSYARYLLCIKEGRWLEPWEDADHVDDDRLHDEPNNLQVLSKAENAAKRSTGVALVTLICPSCELSFERERRQTHLVKGGVRTYCSRSCSARGSHEAR